MEDPDIGDQLRPITLDQFPRCVERKDCAEDGIVMKDSVHSLLQSLHIDARGRDPAGKSNIRDVQPGRVELIIQEKQLEGEERLILHAGSLVHCVRPRDIWFIFHHAHVLPLSGN